MPKWFMALPVAAGVFLYGAVAHAQPDAALVSRAETGDADAEAALGRIYISGKEVKQDFTLAAHWLQKAADQGQVTAALDLGKMYFMGEGVAMDRAQGAREWEIAARGGEPSAPALLARHYYTQGFDAQQKTVTEAPALKAFFWAAKGVQVDPNPRVREKCEEMMAALEAAEPSLKSKADALAAARLFPGD